MVSERLRSLRDRLQRAETSKRAERRARSRRVEREEPEGAGEAAQVKVRQAREETQETAEEARGLASDAKTLIATELGISRSEAESVIQQGSSLLNEAGDRVEELDFDDDGDTDLLNALEAPLNEGNGGGGGGQSLADPLDPVDPVTSADEEIFDPFAEDDDLM